MIKTGASTIPVIGVKVEMNTNGVGGVIASVESDGPAAKAGLKAGDIVVKVDDTIVRDSSEFIVALRAHDPGQTVTLTLKDGTSLKLTLGSRKTTS